MGKFFGKILEPLEIIKKNQRESWMIFLLDLCFIAAFLAAHSLFTTLAKTISVSGFGFSVFVYSLMSILYYSAIISVYSFFKMQVISYCSLALPNFPKARISMAKFIGLNLLLAAVFFAIMLSFNFILYGLKPNAQLTLFFIAAPAYLVYLYFSVQSSHFYFLKSGKISSSLKKGTSSIFSDFSKIKNALYFSAACIAFSAAALWIAGYTLKLAYSGNNMGYLTAYSNFRNISVMLFYLIAYLLNFVNRFYFLSLAEK